MDHATANRNVLMAGRSPALVAAFQTVTESEAGGEPKFSPRICHELAKAISCRVYAPAVLELCHLVRMVGGGGYEAFFWGTGPALASQFRAQAKRFLATGNHDEATFRATDDGIVAEYADGTFAVTYGRMPFLSALMEFLVTALGYADLDDVFQKLHAAPPTRAAVSERANELSRLVYDYLKDHLPTAQNQRSFQRLLAFLSGRAGETGASWSLDDTAVLAFWHAESANPSSKSAEFRTFRSVFLSFVRLHQVLEAAHDLGALERPLPIGTNRGAGEVDPETVQRMVKAVEVESNPLDALAEAPANAVKFLTKRETGAVELMVGCGKTARALPLSVMRCKVFGHAQARLTQARRRNRGAREMATFIGDSVAGTYGEEMDGLADVAGRIEKVLLAAFYALVRAHHSEAIAVLIVLKPHMDMRALARHLPLGPATGGNVVALDAERVACRFMEMIEDSRRVGPEISGLVAQARSAFRSLGRRGFSDTAGPEAARGFAAGATALAEIRKRLDSFMGTLAETVLPEGDWSQQFTSDRQTFLEQFHLLYGGTQ
jgi:hypothetical protein